MVRKLQVSRLFPLVNIGFGAPGVGLRVFGLKMHSSRSEILVQDSRHLGFKVHN